MIERRVHRVTVDIYVDHERWTDETDDKLANEMAEVVAANPRGVSTLHAGEVFDRKDLQVAAVHSWKLLDAEAELAGE